MLVQLAVRRPASSETVDSAPFVSPVQSYSTIWKTIESGRPVMIDDVRGETSMAIAYRSQVGVDLDRTPVAYVRSWAAVPLVARDRVTGMLAIAHRESGAFDQRDVELVTAVASQAAVAIENVRLYEEAVQRTTELNTLLVADSELHRSLSLDTVLEALVDVMVDSLKADKCIVSMRAPDSDHLVIRAQRNFSPAAIARFNEIFAQRRNDGGPIEVKGVVTHESTSSMEPAVRAVLEQEGVHSTLDAPIITPDGVAGGFDLGFSSPHTFTAYELRLAQSIAERAGVAIRNAQLVDEAAQRSRETEALLRADADLFGSLTLDRVLQSLADVAVDVLGADKSLVLLHEGDVDQIRASRNFTASNVATSNQALLGLPHVEPPPEGQTPQVYVRLTEAPDFIREGLEREGVISHVSVPVRDRERMLGVFGVSFVTEHPFSDSEVRLYQALADRAAVAIQNAELYARAQRAGSLEERQRLARELHDSVSQALYGIALGTRTARLRLGDDPQNAAEPIDYVASLAQAGLAEMRALIFELRPESLEQEGLIAAIEKHAASTRARYGLDVRLELMDEPECSIEIKEALYRIAQEALHNVVKHANAQQVNVTLEQDDDRIVLTVADDGQGFDASASFPGHVGLQSMPERAGRLGGTVEVTSMVGQGTRVTARLPG